MLIISDERIDQKPFISVVTPVYNAPEIVGELYSRLCNELEKLTTEEYLSIADDIQVYARVKPKQKMSLVCRRIKKSSSFLQITVLKILSNEEILFL